MTIRTGTLGVAVAGAVCIALAGAGLSQAAASATSTVGGSSGSTIVEAAGSPITLPYAPTVVTTSRDGSFIYAGGGSTPLGSGISVINAVTRQFVSTIPLPAANGVVNLVLSRDGTRLYTCTVDPNDGPSVLFTIDTATNAIIATAPCSPAGLSTQTIALSADNGRIWSAGNDPAGTVFSFDPVSGAVLSTLATGSGFGEAVALNPAGTKLYVGTQLGDFGVVDVATNTYTLLYHSTGQYHQVAVSPDGTVVLFAMSGGSLGMYSAVTGMVTAVPLAGGSPYGLAVSPSWNYAYVTLQSSDQVAVVDLATGSLVRKVSVGHWPMWPAIAPDASALYVPNALAGTLTVLDLQHLTVTVPSTISIGAANVTATLALSGGGVTPGTSTGTATVDVIDSRGVVVATASAVALDGSDSATVPLYPTLGTPAVRSAGAPLSSSTAGLPAGVYSIRATLTAGADPLVATATGVTLREADPSVAGTGDGASALAATGVDARPILALAGALLVAGILALAIVRVRRARRRRAHRR